MINALCQDKSQTKNPVLKGFGKKKRLRVFLLIEVCLLLWFWGVLEFWVYGFGGLGFVVVWGLFFCWGNKLKYVGTVLGFLKHRTVPADLRSISFSNFNLLSIYI